MYTEATATTGSHLAEIVAKFIYMLDKVTDAWITVTWTNSTADGGCGLPYQAVCSATDAGQTFIGNLTHSIEALVVAIPHIVQSFATTPLS